MEIKKILSIKSLTSNGFGIKPIDLNILNKELNYEKNKLFN